MASIKPMASIDCLLDEPALYLDHTVDDDILREREVHKFYQPYEDLLNDSALPQSQSPAARKPCSSPDRALTAFAQLGALRLNSRYGIISMFDRKFQFVIAEATRTLSLQQDEVHENTDELWLGVTKFARSGSPCERGAGLLDPPDAKQGQDAGASAAPRRGDVCVIPDLSVGEYGTGPLVQEQPYCRFYAGAPIVSPDGYTIGVYCVYDDMPRKGLSDSETRFMKDMAATVMDQLEMIRYRSELRRSQSMVYGLGNFIDAKPMDSYNLKVATSNTDGAPSPQDKRHSDTLEARPVTSSTAFVAPVSTDISPETATNISCPPQYKKQKVPAAFQGERTGLHGRADASISSKQVETVGNNRTDNDHMQEECLSDGVRATFQRAADTIRDSMALDGAIFLDGSIGTHGGLVQRAWDRRQSFPSLSTQDTATSSKHVPGGDKSCVILGSSLPKSPMSPGPKHFQIQEHLLHGLLECYPRGTIWTFEERDDESRKETQDHDLFTLDTQTCQIEEQRKEKAMIQQLFPGVRSLAFTGLWDSHRERWFAAAFLWTTTPTRVLYPDVDLRFAFAFGQSVMAEIARLDIKMADKAKATFISSISHELRTPLHGILGSSEHLQSTEMDVFQNGLLGTIETCGKTLLETFDNLLAFAKVNNLMTSSKARRSSWMSPAKPNVPLSDIGLQLTDIDLSLLTEEVLETAFAGYEFIQIYPIDSDVDPGGPHRTDAASSLQGSLRQEADRPETIDIILDINNPASDIWTFETEAGGWRRVILNLVGNSLKYTDKGSILVRLESTPLSAGLGQTQVTLTVSDTGRGMSEEFQQGQLFAPFVQEDPLVPGTGLGLSIVKQIVTGMGGTVSVKSKKDLGTEIRIGVPLTPSSNMESRPSDPCYDKPSFESLRVTMLDTALCAGNPSLGSTFAKQCGKWFGLNPRFSAEFGDADVYVISNARIDAFIEHIQSTASSGTNPLEGRALIIMCRHLSSVQTRKAIDTYVPRSCWVEYLCQPLGPRKMAKVLSQCLGFLEGRYSPGSKTSAGSLSVDGPRGLRRDSYVSSSAWMYGQHKPSRRSSNPHNLMIPATINDVEVSEPLVANSAPFDILEEAVLSPINGDTVLPHCVDPGPKPRGGSAASDQPPFPSGLSILLVDDNRINLQLLETFMKKNKHRYDTAMNGFEALQTYKTAHAHAHTPADSPTSTQLERACPYNYILMDINMPVMDGLEATREIRAFELEEGIKPAMIVALTGMGSASAQQEAFASGVDLFLTKPVRLKELAQILANVEQNQET